MEMQTLQQEVPVYHVCQECNGHGCVSCSDLLILDGDIQLDPEWVDELPELSPINGVIGVNAAWKPAYEYIVVWKEDGKPYNKCFTNEADSLAHFEALIGRASSVCMVYPDGQSFTELPAPKPVPKYDISFDDRNMYQRREDELRLAGEWEV